MFKAARRQMMTLPHFTLSLYCSMVVIVASFAGRIPGLDRVLPWLVDADARAVVVVLALSPAVAAIFYQWWAAWHYRSRMSTVDNVVGKARVQLLATHGYGFSIDKASYDLGVIAAGSSATWALLDEETMADVRRTLAGVLLEDVLECVERLGAPRRVNMKDSPRRRLSL